MAAAVELGKSRADRDKEIRQLAAATFGKQSTTSGVLGRLLQAWRQQVTWNTVTPALLKARVAYTVHEEEILAPLRELVSVPYSAEDVAHERSLKQLFAAVKSPAEARDLPAGKDPRWKELGFQSEDPRTDFRGGGLFALHNLIFLAEAYPERTLRMMQQAAPATSSGSGVAEYLFAAACINVSAILVLLLGLNSTPSMRPVPSMPCPANGIVRKRFARLLAARVGQQADIESGAAVPMLIVREVFGELFCACVFKLHAEWRALCVRKPNATLLDFGEALSATTVAIERFLVALTPEDTRSLSLIFERLEGVDPACWQTMCFLQLARGCAFVLELTCRLCAVLAQLLEELSFGCWQKSSIQ
eukprot:TRINITY_DN29900_c0_g1_i1.p1 TRINITY_DN29900_c0_g1~~TRINITY_DN29900_c0_g1_i1.p1  ORF type:complete len:361 (+),score=75.15 TRINITY_DN29900_c0_g1_i1:38-1120(+)